MTLSMTGFGRGSSTVADYCTVTVDLKTVNHRYLDLNFRVPRNYAMLEDVLRRKLSKVISRGKVDVVVNVDSFSEDSIQATVNENVIAAYMNAAASLKKKYALKGKLDMATLMALPDVVKCTKTEIDSDKLIGATEAAVDEALKMLLQMREVEGRQLVNDLSEKIASMEKLRSEIALQAGKVVPIYREKLLKRIEELTDGIEVDAARIATEVAIFADKADVNEELVRLESHFKQFLAAFEAKEPIGRKLDFLIQEMHREINTIGSKANDLQIAQVVIAFKAELEKLREQVQNIE